MKRAFSVILIAALVLFAGCQSGNGSADTGSTIAGAGGGSNSSGPTDSGSNGSIDSGNGAGQIAPDSDKSDATIGDLFANQQSNVQVSGAGTVIRLLDDDNTGDRHQRFILELASGQTLLVAHNIDIAPRLDGLAVGDEVGFCGEYIFSDQGGTIHWTHRDPSGKHVAGWLEWNGKKYQ